MGGFSGPDGIQVYLIGFRAAPGLHTALPLRNAPGSGRRAWIPGGGGIPDRANHRIGNAANAALPAWGSVSFQVVLGVDPSLRRKAEAIATRRFRLSPE